MKKSIAFLCVFAFLLVASHTLFAQNGNSSNCQFVFKGTLAGKSVTICFMPDENDGRVHGEYYYGNGSNGVMSFTGTAKRQKDGSFAQRLEETNADGVVTGYFTGILAKGVMTGTWTSTDGKRSYPYKLKMQ
jgi:hypothetical protein